VRRSCAASEEAKTSVGKAECQSLKDHQLATTIQWQVPVL